jgi:nucleotide-binding universal stress UspA family protein
VLPTWSIGPGNGNDMTSAATGAVVFAYDGSDLAKMAIGESSSVLNHGRAALVLTVWQPFNVGFVSPRELQIDAAAADEVKTAAEQTAAQGAKLAQEAGFEAHSIAVEASPAWKGIVEAADDQDASLIVLGSHGRTGLASVLLGSVAEAVAAHSRRSVLIVHRRP